MSTYSAIYLVDRVVLSCGHTVERARVTEKEAAEMEMHLVFLSPLLR